MQACNVSKRIFQFNTVELEGRLWRTSFWHLCAAMGRTAAETNTGLPLSRNPTEIQSVSPSAQKVVNNISLVIDQHIFDHNQSHEYTRSSNVSFCNQSHYTHHVDWCLIVWHCDWLIPAPHTIGSTGCVLCRETGKCGPDLHCRPQRSSSFIFLSWDRLA